MDNTIFQANFIDIEFIFRLMKIVSGVLATLFIIALSVMNMPSTHASINGPVRLPVNVQVFDPCGNNGRGEIINFNGYEEVFTVVNQNPAGGGDVAILHANLAVSGVGETTGTKYQSMEGATSTFTLNGQPAAERTDVLAFRLISQGSDQNSIFHINDHATLTPDGTITSDFINSVFITC